MIDDACLARRRAGDAHDSMRDVEERIRVQNAYRDSLPTRYRRATLADLSDARRKALCAWAETSTTSWGLVLTGPPGRGKTHAACALGHEYTRLGGRAAFANWPAWVTEQKAKMDGGGRNRHSWDATAPSDLATFDGLLLLDDVGAGRLTEYVSGLLSEVVSEREANLLPTVFTTNGTLADFGAVDGRISSRLSGAKWLTFAGDDLRPNAVPHAPPTIPPPPASVEEVVTEAEQQQIEGFDASAFFENWHNPADTDWRLCMAPWHRRFTQRLARTAARND